MEDSKHIILIMRDDMDLNKVTLMGRLGKDPDFFKTQKGDEFCKMRLATGVNSFDQRTQQYTSVTTWHDVVVYSPLFVKVVKERVKKGTKLYIEGSIKYTEFTSREGVAKHTTQIIVSNAGGVLKIAEQPKAQNVIPEQGYQDCGNRNTIEDPFHEDNEFYIDDFFGV